jgi:GT2 family glycosyltransferase
MSELNDVVDDSLSPPWLSVIIPHYNDVTRLRVCLKALEPQVVGQPVEVVVVDNGSSDGVGALPQEFPSFRFDEELQKGAACARNRGVDITTAPNLLFIDADCVPSEHWLARGLELAGQARLVGGRVDTFDETPPPRSGPEAFERVFAFRQKMYVERKGFSGSGNLLTTREVFKDAGPMVPGLSEDLEWCFRATGKGYPLIYDDDLAVSHPTRQDWPALVRKWRRTTDESFYLNGTGALARVRWFIRAFVVLGSSIVHLPVLLTSSKLRDGGERRRAALTLVRTRVLRWIWMLRQTAGYDWLD